MVDPFRVTGERAGARLADHDPIALAGRFAVLSQDALQRVGADLARTVGFSSMLVSPPNMLP